MIWKGDICIALCIIIQAGATIGYLIDGDWRQSLVWLGVVISNAAYLSLTRS